MSWLAWERNDNKNVSMRASNTDLQVQVDGIHLICLQQQQKIHLGNLESKKKENWNYDFKLEVKQAKKK